jgi:hypothetical protein
LKRRERLTHHEALAAIGAALDVINTQGSLVIGSKEAMDLIDALDALKERHHGC